MGMWGQRKASEIGWQVYLSYEVKFSWVGVSLWSDYGKF